MGDRKLGPHSYVAECYSYIVLSKVDFLCFIGGGRGIRFFCGIFHIRPLHCEKHLCVLGG